MTDGSVHVFLSAGDKTEELINFVFRGLSDELTDQIELQRVADTEGGVARELITAGAILTFAPALGIPVFRLVERWMEINRQKSAVKLICEAGKEDKAIMKTLAELEKKHADVMVSYGKLSGFLPGRKKPA
jgi:hypothetical protein